jgi:hypothetical protein
MNLISPTSVNKTITSFPQQQQQQQHQQNQSISQHLLQQQHHQQQQQQNLLQQIKKENTIPGLEFEDEESRRRKVNEVIF